MIDVDYDGYSSDVTSSDSFLKGIFGDKETRAAKVEAKKTKTAIKKAESDAKIEAMKGDLAAQQALINGAGASDTGTASSGPNYILWGGIGIGVIVVMVVVYLVFIRK